MATLTPYIPLKNTFERNQLTTTYRRLRRRNPAMARLLFQRTKAVEQALLRQFNFLETNGPTATDPPPFPSPPIDP